MLQLPANFGEIFEPQLLKEIQKEAQIIALPAGSVLIDIGQKIRAMPIVLKGSLKISRIDEHGNELLLYYITAQESCAMTFTCCMGTQSSEIKGIAEEDAEILAVPIFFMEAWITQ